jgi:hypothetical protein
LKNRCRGPAGDVPILNPSLTELSATLLRILWYNASTTQPVSITITQVPASHIGHKMTDLDFGQRHWFMDDACKKINCHCFRSEEGKQPLGCGTSKHWKLSKHGNIVCEQCIREEKCEL